MTRESYLLLRIVLFCTPVFFIQSTTAQDLSRQEYLEQLLKVLPEDKPSHYHLPGEPPPRVSPEDLIWTEWQRRTGELPPDFDEMPSIPFLPNPLILDEGGKNIPVKTMSQWNQKREQLKKEAQHWITGTFPPPPDNLEFELLEERKL